MANRPQNDDFTDEELDALIAEWNKEEEELARECGLTVPPIPEDDGSEMQVLIGPIPKPKQPARRRSDTP